MSRTQGLTGRRRSSRTHEPVYDIPYERCKACGSSWPKHLRIEWGWTHCGNCGLPFPTNDHIEDQPETTEPITTQEDVA